MNYTNETYTTLRTLINGGKLTMKQREEIYLYISDLEVALEKICDDTGIDLDEYLEVSGDTK